MNTTMIAGVLRALLAAAAGYLAGRGVDITGIASPEVTGALATVIVAVWSVFAKKEPAA
jgi:membrane protein DedA with SNARE-associated domain